MGAYRQPLLVISRDTLLNAESSSHAGKIFRLLANVTRKGHHLLLTAPEPDQWFPTRGKMDDALSYQGRLLERLHEAGGDFDGIYYVPRSLFTQDRNREGALQDILSRYGAEPGEALLISASAPFLRAAERLGIRVCEVQDGPECAEPLEATLKPLADD